MQVKLITDYALRILIYLGLKNSVANSKEIASQLDIPQKNVLSIGRKLKKTNYVSIISGPYGGYIIKRAPENILIYDVFSIFADIKISCLFREKKAHQNIADSIAIQLYSELQEMFEEKLKSYTLADLISEHQG